VIGYLELGLDVQDMERELWDSCLRRPPLANNPSTCASQACVLACAVGYSPSNPQTLICAAAMSAHTRPRR